MQVSLSLAEKQKLAKEQELQQQFKTQTPLMATSGGAKSQQPQVRDLTSSLLNMDIMSQRQKPNTPLLLDSSAPTPPFANGTKAPVAAPAPSGSGWMGGKNQYASLGTVAATGNVNRASPVQQPMRTSFAGPLTPQQPVRPMSQAVSSNTSHARSATFGAFNTANPISNTSMNTTHTRPMMPNTAQQNTVFGMQPMNPHRPAFSSAPAGFGVGVMGGAPVMGGFSQPSQPNTATKKLSSQELADFLG